MTEFKIGDRVLYLGLEAEVVGFGEDISEAIYIRYPSMCTTRSNLKKLPDSLKEGQEVWVKCKVRKSAGGEITSQGDCAIMYEYNAGDRTSAWSDMRNIYVKNDQGEIVPYVGE